MKKILSICFTVFATFCLFFSAAQNVSAAEEKAVDDSGRWYYLDTYFTNYERFVDNQSIEYDPAKNTMSFWCKFVLKAKPETPVYMERIEVDLNAKLWHIAECMSYTNGELKSTPPKNTSYKEFSPEQDYEPAVDHFCEMKGIAKIHPEADVRWKEIVNTPKQTVLIATDTVKVDAVNQHIAFWAKHIHQPDEKHPNSRTILTHWDSDLRHESVECTGKDGGYKIMVLSNTFTEKVFLAAKKEYETIVNANADAKTDEKKAAEKK